MNKNIVTIREKQFGSGASLICVPIVARDGAQLETELSFLEEAPFDLVEFRADCYLGSLPEGAWEKMRQALLRIRREIGEKPLLFTVRTKEEGGEAAVGLSDYSALNLAAAREGLADLVDIEYRTGGYAPEDLISRVKSYGCAVICSSHDFEKTPSLEEMKERMMGMQKTGADMTKLAVMPSTRTDVLRLMELSVLMEEQLADRPFITMSMGKLGGISRLACRFTGSALTFGAAGAASAPGQMPAAALWEAMKLL